MFVGLIFGHPNVCWQNVCHSNVCQPYGYRLNVCQPNVYQPNASKSCNIKHCLSQMFLPKVFWPNDRVKTVSTIVMAKCLLVKWLFAKIFWPNDRGKAVSTKPCINKMSFAQMVLDQMYFGQMTKLKLCQPNIVQAKCQHFLCQANVFFVKHLQAK